MSQRGGSKNSSKKHRGNKSKCQNRSSESRVYDGSPFPKRPKPIRGRVIKPGTSRNPEIFPGEVKLEGEIKSALESVWRNRRTKLPDTVKLCFIDPVAIASISRADKRRLLLALADQKGVATVEVIESGSAGKENHFKEVFKGSLKQQLSLATIFALSVAMGSDETDIFAELVGLATPETVLELSQFLLPPLITLGKLSKLIHCASRSITHDPNDPHGRAPNPVLLSWSITKAIAAVLRECKIKESDPILQNLVRKTFLHADNDKDRGCQVGLLVAGVQHYVRGGKERVDKRLKKAETIIEIVTGLLGGVPGGGFAFASVGSILKYVFYKKAEDATAKDVSQAMKMYFCQVIRGPIFLDGEISFKRVNGRILVDKTVFREWFEEMLEWAGI